MSLKFCFFILLGQMCTEGVVPGGRRKWNRDPGCFLSSKGHLPNLLTHTFEQKNQFLHNKCYLISRAQQVSSNHRTVPQIKEVGDFTPVLEELTAQEVRQIPSLYRNYLQDLIKQEVIEFQATYYGDLGQTSQIKKAVIY